MAVCAFRYNLKQVPSTETEKVCVCVRRHTPTPTPTQTHKQTNNHSHTQPLSREEVCDLGNKMLTGDNAVVDTNTKPKRLAANKQPRHVLLHARRQVCARSRIQVVKLRDGLDPAREAGRVWRRCHAQVLAKQRARMVQQRLLTALLNKALVLLALAAANWALFGKPWWAGYNRVLVIVGGAELFTGNNLIVMALASGRITIGDVLRNWVLVYLGNLVGAVFVAALVFLAGHHEGAGGQVGLTALKIANAKCAIPFVEAFARGVLCNLLVCLAVWLCFSARSTADKVLASARGEARPLVAERLYPSGPPGYSKKCNYEKKRQTPPIVGIPRAVYCSVSYTYSV